MNQLERIELNELKHRMDEAETKRNDALERNDEQWFDIYDRTIDRLQAEIDELRSTALQTRIDAIYEPVRGHHPIGCR